MDVTTEAAYCGEEYLAVVKWDELMGQLFNDTAEQSADAAWLSTEPAAVAVGAVPIFGATHTTERSANSLYITEQEYEGPCSAANTGSAVELSPCDTANNWNVVNSHFGVYGGRTAQLQGTVYVQNPTLQLQSDSSTSQAVPGVYQPPVMATSRAGPQLCSMLMPVAVPAPAQQEVWLPGYSQGLQHNVSTNSNKRCAASAFAEPSGDLEYNPYTGSQPEAQPRRKKERVTPATQPTARARTVNSAAKGATAPKRRGSATSSYRGVSMHKYSRKWEAHLWDGKAHREPTKKTKRTKGRQISLGSHHSEAEAARAYDRASLAFFGSKAETNFPKWEYANELSKLQGAKREVVVQHLRSNWKMYACKPKYPGVYPHQALPGLWEARLATSNLGYKYLGTYASEEAAHQALDTYRKLQASLISLQQ